MDMKLKLTLCAISIEILRSTPSIHLWLPNDYNYDHNIS